MSNNSNTFRLGNEQLLLINILNTMYNDNLRQINNVTEMLNNLTDSNNQIRNLLVQLLHNQHQTQENNARRNGASERRSRNDRNNAYNSNRIYVNNRPYIIDSITEYTIPRRSSLRNGATNQIDTNSLLNNFLNSFMQPVEVYPTSSQIEAATRLVRYCDISRPVYNQCPISLEEFNDSDMVTVIRHCGHIFHTEHLMNWFRSNCRCPVCRFDIREYNSNASTEFYSNSTDESSQRQRQTRENIDSSNNILERNETNNVIDNIPNNEFNDVFNDSFLDNIIGTTDLSGNQIDNMLTGTATLFYLLNSMNNRSRHSR